MKKVLVDPNILFFTLLAISKNNETQRETHSVAISKIAQV